MGVTYTVDEDIWDGAIRRRARVEAAFDSSYTSGGEALAASDVGFGSINAVYFQEPVTEGGYIASYRAGDGTVKVYETGGAGATLTEVAGATDLSTESCTLIVEGRS